MKKGFKCLMASALLAQVVGSTLLAGVLPVEARGLAASVIAAGASTRSVSRPAVAQASSRSESLAEGSSEPSSEAGSDTEHNSLTVPLETAFFMQVDAKLRQLKSVAIVGEAGDDQNTRRYQAAFRYGEEGAVDQAYVGYEQSNGFQVDIYYPNDAAHGVYAQENEGGNWVTLSTGEPYAPKPDYHRIVRWIRDHARDFDWEETADGYRLTVLRQDFDLIGFAEEALGSRLQPESIPIERLYKSVEVYFDADYQMTRLTYRCLDPTGEVQGDYRFSYYNQLKEADFQLPDDAPISPTSGQDGRQSESSGAESTSSESSSEGTTRASASASASVSDREGRREPRMPNDLYWLVSLKWRQEGMVSRTLSALLNEVLGLTRPPRVYR